MINARTKGHAFEREMAETFRKHGWIECKTSRQASGKLVDDSGRDLIDTQPFNVQLKAVENLGSPHLALKHMPDDGNINIVMHKRNHKGTIVAMSEEDFFKIAGFIPSRSTLNGED